ncbi:hypothetical protein GPLA_3042 [Paraglaciecola polaris LMG 21857]|uniref:Uncharacterized protein n=1 Tax=Paraglaciecola polaris LMG 21857 TaxID=1129793 RepID=K7AF57_9ALTE|nr:hypothetical protein GPLA_3042 [Paraglaciecola polaris LMG 21857]
MEFFVISRQSPLLFVLALFSVLFVSGCAVDKRPEAYSNAILVSSAFPAHGSSQSQYAALQQALLSRNLLIADNGEVLPVMKGMCEADMLYHISSTNLPPYIGQHQDLYAGFYFDVALVNGSWKVVNTDNDFGQFNSEFDLALLTSVLTPRIMPNDTLTIRPQPNVTAKALGELMSLMQSVFPVKRTRFVVSSKFAKQVEQAGYDLVLSSAGASHLYLGDTLSTSAAQERTFFKLDYTANAELKAFAASEQPLVACMQAHNFVQPPSKKFSNKLKANDLPSVVNVLPSNADFNQLSEQQRLFTTGQYLTINGDVLKYSTYQKLQAGSRCSRLAPSDPLYKYCEDRKQDVSTDYIRRKATMRKQGN